MADEQGPNHDLYCYDGRRKLKARMRAESNESETPQIRHPRQDSAIDFNTIADVLHHEFVGTLFAPQAAVQSLSEVRSDSDSARIVDLNSTGPEVIPNLRNWRSSFELPQAYVDQNQASTPEIDGPPRVLRKRSCTTEAILRDYLLQAPSACRDQSTNTATVPVAAPNESAPNLVTGNEADVATVEERSISPLDEVLPSSPTEGTPEWTERQRVREEYKAIELARENRMRRENENAEIHEAHLRLIAREWEDEKREWEQKYNRAKMAQNLALFDALTRNDGNLATSDETERQYRGEEDRDDIQEELDCRDDLITAAEKMMYRDAGTYKIPLPWNMGDRPRRARLYQEPDDLERYLKQEARLVPLMEERLDCLHEGRSGQRQSAVIAEIRDLESLLAVHRNGESNNERLTHDFLRYAHHLMRADSVNGTHVMRNTDGSAFTDGFPPFMLKFVRSYPRLKQTFRQIREFEKSHFPERLEVTRQRHSLVQHTPSGRRIPIRQPIASQITAQSTPSQYDGSSTAKGFGDPLERVDSRQTPPRMAQTLPRSFKAKAPKILALLRSKGEPYFPVSSLEPKIHGDPTSPTNPPVTERLRPPKPKRQSPLRLASLPRSPGLYIPSKPPSPKPLSRSEFYSKRGYVGPDDFATRKLNPPRLWLSSIRIRRQRALQEPVTPENIENFLERNRVTELGELFWRQRSMPYEVYMNYTALLNHLNARNSDPTSGSSQSNSAQGNRSEQTEIDESRRVLRVVNVDPTEGAERIEDTTGTVYTELLEDNETLLRVVDVVQAENVDGNGVIDSAHLIDSIEELEKVDYLEEAEQSPIPQPENRPTGSLVRRIIEREVMITVEEIEGYDTEDEESAKPKKGNRASRY